MGRTSSTWVAAIPATLQIVVHAKAMLLSIRFMAITPQSYFLVSQHGLSKSLHHFNEPTVNGGRQWHIRRTRKLRTLSCGVTQDQAQIHVFSHAEAVAADVGG